MAYPSSAFYNSLRFLRWQRLAAGILTTLLLMIAIGAIAYGLIAVIEATKDIMVATIAGVASLLSAVFTYVFQRTRELELTQIRHEMDLILADRQHDIEINLSQRRIKQENYSRILEKLAPYVRNPSKNADEFTTAYLHTWVMGSPAVVQAVATFLNIRDHESLDSLLLAMRQDLKSEDSRYYEECELKNLSSKGLFPTPPPVQTEDGLR